jgi:hypothetical protein
VPQNAYRIPPRPNEPTRPPGWRGARVRPTSHPQQPGSRDQPTLIFFEEVKSTLPPLHPRASKESPGQVRQTGERETPLNSRDRTFPTEPNTARPTPFMKQSDYARHSGLSKCHVCGLVKKGLPLNTPEAADQWRRQHVWSRKPPAPAGPPAPSTADPTPAPKGRPPEATERPAAIDPAALDSTRVGQAFQRLEKAERVCWGLLCAALKTQAPDCARLLDLHSRSVRHLADNRQTVLDLAQRERQLVSGDWVRRVMQEHDGAVATLLRTMPRQLSGRIAPHDPEHAERELQRWVQEVALATLHSTDPWKK